MVSSILKNVSGSLGENDKIESDVNTELDLIILYFHPWSFPFFMQCPFGTIPKA